MSNNEWNFRWYYPVAEKLWKAVELFEKKYPGYTVVCEHYNRGYYYFSVNDNCARPFRTQRSAIRFFKKYNPLKIPPEVLDAESETVQGFQRLLDTIEKAV